MKPEELTLSGRYVRLEPLAKHHIQSLSTAAAPDPSLDDPTLYNWSPIPQGIAATTRYVETALNWRNAGTAVPFAVVRLSDNTVIGSTRFWNIERWLWPQGHERYNNPYPDACEIGYSWYARSAIRTAVNTEAKFLLLTHAFEVWNALRICLHTDLRNTRSQAAIERLGCKREGILRAHRMSSDFIPRDSVRFSMIASEWPEAKQRLANRLYST